MWSITGKERLKRAGNAFIAAVSLASGLLVLAPLLIAVSVAIAALIAGHRSLAYAALGAIGALLLLAVLGFTVANPVIRRLLYGYRLERLELVHTIERTDHRRHRLQVYLVVWVIRPGLRLLQHGYTYSGPDTNEGEGPYSHSPRIVGRGAQDVYGPEPDGPSWVYWLRLGGVLSARKKREIRVEHEFFDADGTFQSRVAEVVNEPIDLLVLRVRVPDELWPLDAEGYVSVSGQDRPRGLALEIDVAGRELRLEVANPVFGREYGIKWTVQAREKAADSGATETLESDLA